MSIKLASLSALADEAGLTATIQPTAPFTFKASVKSLRESGATDLLDSFGPENEWLERPVQLNGRPFLLRLSDLATSPEAPLLSLALRADDAADHPPASQDLQAAAEWANRRFLLDVDMEAVRQALIVEEYGEDLAARYWPARPAQLPSAWEGLIKTVISVQIYPGLASRLQRALLDFYGERATFEGKEYHFYPKAERLAAILPEDLLGMRFSRQKARYIPGISQAILEQPTRFDWERLRQLPGEEAVAILDELPGVGPWTANYVAMRGLPHLDVFIEEEGLRKTLAAALDRRAVLSVAEAAKLMAVYAPYRSFACYYTYMKMYSA